VLGILIFLEGTKKIPEGSICVNQIDEIGQTERQIDRKRHCKVTKFGDLTMGVCDKALRTTIHEI